MITQVTTFQNELKDLDNFLASAELQLNQILTQFNWSKKDLEDSNDNNNLDFSSEDHDTTLVQCNVDLHHWVPKFKLEEHTVKCKLKKYGVSSKILDEELPSDKFIYENRDGVVCLSTTLTSVPKLVPVEIPDAYNLQPRHQDHSSSNVPPPPSYPPPPPPSQPPPPSIPPPPISQPPSYPQVYPQQAYQQYMQYPYGIPQNYNDMMYREEPISYGIVVADEYFPELQNHASLRSNYTKMKQFILSWTRIPNSYKTLDFSSIDSQKILNWLFRQAYKYVPGYVAPSAEQNYKQIQQPQNVFADEETLNYFLTVLTQNDPERSAKVLSNKFHQNTTEFIVSVWKYIALEVLEARRKILVDAGQVVEGEFEQDMKFENVQSVSKGDDYPIFEAIHSDKPLQGEVTPRASTTYQKYLRYLHDVYVARSIRLNRTHSSIPINVEYVPKLSKNRETKKKSQLEILQEQRERKKRRKKYRAQNVHITKRTPIMVARDLINKRMEELTGVSSSNNASENTDMDAEQGYHDRNQPRYPPKHHERGYDRQYDKPRDERGYGRQYGQDRHEKGHGGYERHDRPQHDRQYDKPRDERSYGRQDRPYDNRSDRRNDRNRS